ncbi:MAG: D-alanyl-D-alanine carboxypeptidase/D-alanyl-D-alanine-endopeptidase [Propionibacteriales bacterium]|nr:D-alanyl-D-alanine carboxypeptidase/D-alanyl-D-alanine-endopeptidase [Propionibacteriales bacterium]
MGAGGYAAYVMGWADSYLGPGEPLAPAAVPPPADLNLPNAEVAGPVLQPAHGRGPAPRALRRHVADSLAYRDLGRHLGVLVEDLSTDRELLRVGGGDSFVPASTLKLLPSTAALELLGPDHRFTTQVVQGRRPREIVLVGGGDPLLARTASTDGEPTYPEPATIRRLARGTARELRERGVRSVRLAYDDSLFAGPAESPHWEPGYVSGHVVSPISALWVDRGEDAAGFGARVADPSLAAAQEFAAALGRAGIDVRDSPDHRRAPARSRTLASVESPPLAQIVQHLLEVSDNETTEVLLRHVALATGRPGSFAAGVDVARRTLKRLGVDLSGTRFFDGSGLSRKNRLTLDALADTLRLASSPDQPDLRPVVAGLPVAGFIGTGADRFEVRADAGLGVARLKTGTLSGVTAYAGVVLDRDGAALTFVAVADRVQRPRTLGARAALDTLAAGVASCGCAR